MIRYKSFRLIVLAASFGFLIGCGKQEQGSSTEQAHPAVTGSDTAKSTSSGANTYVVTAAQRATEARLKAAAQQSGSAAQNIGEINQVDHEIIFLAQQIAPIKITYLQPQQGFLVKVRTLVSSTLVLGEVPVVNYPKLMDRVHFITAYHGEAEESDQLIDIRYEGNKYLIREQGKHDDVISIELQEAPPDIEANAKSPSKK